MSTDPLAHVKHLGSQLDVIKKRDPKYKEADISCVRTIAQAAVNVELFTIPLYMVSMYSITGLHQINSKDSDFYTGRWWPGRAPVPKPSDANGQAFNLIFSVFIEEMLHLQLAANMAAKIGAVPSFTSNLLMNDNYGWICYNSTTIPHILDFKDCVAPYDKVRVKLDAMNESQVQLFLAIEETEDTAQSHLKPEALHKYFEKAPFNWWTTDKTEADLPLFGSIGWMYTCFWDYLEIEYTDGTTMLQLLTEGTSDGQQRDQFNTEPKEYPGIYATIDDKKDLRVELINIINAITDQGEGKGVVDTIRKRWNLRLIQAVEKQFQPSPPALKEKYPGYNDKGQQTPISGQAESRISAAAIDHYDVFSKVAALINTGNVETWDKWHARPENKWTAKMLNPTGAKSTYNIPSADAVADALNSLKEHDAQTNYKMLSQAAIGTIKGITTQLDLYWKGSVSQFPSPAMYGSGDRVSICWAVMGEVPDLSIGIGASPAFPNNHACQGMNLNQPPAKTDSCAAVEVFHSCKGSNGCKTEGGCGFVQNSQGGSNCTSKVEKVEGRCGLPTMSAPANNKCGGFGGCAVPISASQLFPAAKAGESYVMQLYNYGSKPDYKPEELTTIKYDKGDAVYDIAWNAYTTVMKARFPEKPEPKRPPASALRLAFPPST